MIENALYKVVANQLRHIIFDLRLEMPQRSYAARNPTSHIAKQRQNQMCLHAVAHGTLLVYTI